MKRKYIIWIAVAIILACGFVLARDAVFLTGKSLKRGSDTEFDKGSKIQTQELTESQIASLYKLCKVWGYVKYHHPDVISGEVNWDAELFRVMPDVLSASNSNDTNAVLQNWLEAFPVKAENPEWNEEGEAWKELQKEYGGQRLDTAWIQDVDFLGKDLSEYLCSMSDLYISDRENSYAFFDEIGTVSFENEKTYHISDGDMGMYLLGLFRFWNIYEYYSPNVEITIEDWDFVLKDSIPMVASAGDYRGYVRAIAQVVSKTGDAHSSVADKQGFLYYYYGRRFLPCDIQFIDGQVVVTQVSQSETQLLSGDILIEIDGMPLEDRIEEQRKYQAVPEPDKILMQMKHLLLETEKNQAEVRILRGEETKTLQITTLEYQYSYQNPIANGILESANIGYIDPSSLEKGDLENLMKEFGNTDGIIVDLRYYPSTEITYLLSEYIIPTQKVFSYVGFPNQAIPGAFYNLEMMTGKGSLKEQQNDLRNFTQYPGKVILLMDERSQSQSEFAIMSLRQAPNATVVGSPSIGADGNIAKVSLPGQVFFAISGLGVYTPEGGQTQRCGLKPDIECYQTVEGILAGKDELIEKAMELINFTMENGDVIKE